MTGPSLAETEDALRTAAALRDELNAEVVATRKALAVARKRLAAAHDLLVKTREAVGRAVGPEEL